MKTCQPQDCEKDDACVHHYLGITAVFNCRLGILPQAAARDQPRPAKKYGPKPAYEIVVNTKHHKDSDGCIEKKKDKTFGERMCSLQKITAEGPKIKGIHTPMNHHEHRNDQRKPYVRRVEAHGAGRRKEKIPADLRYHKNNRKVYDT